MHGSHGKLNDVHNDSLLVKILIGEDDTPSIDSRVEESLRNISAPNAESWFCDAVQALQQANLVYHFNLDEFITTAFKALASQQVSQGQQMPIEIDHEGRPLWTASAGLEEKVAAMKRKEKDESGGGFWISYGPQATTHQPRVLREREPWEREDDPYGGLM